MNKKIIIDKEEFSFEGISYIARLYKLSGKNQLYGEMVYKESDERPNRKMRAIARGFLKQYDIDVPNEANRLVTHMAVKKVIENIRRNK